MKRRNTLKSQILELARKQNEQDQKIKDSQLKISRDLTRLTRFVVGTQAENGFPASGGLLTRMDNMERRMDSIFKVLVQVNKNTGGEHVE